jgi:predicted dehydrogenase
MLTRRHFIGGTLAAGLSLPGIATARVVRRADPVRLGVIGVRGRGRAHIGDFKESADAEVIAICDADEGVIGPALDAVPDATYYKDVREMLDRADIDAVSIATPNHWHTLAALMALDAGKHVYVEKPISHNLHEGRVLARAAARSSRVVVHGTQARTHVATIEAMQWLREGGLGEVKLARGLCYKRRESIGKVDGVQQPPATCDYDLWTGPAEKRPLMRKELHYDWHWDFNTGNGDIGNQGVHQMDIARWGLGKTGFPRRVRSCGGRLGYDDDGNTPNTQVAVFDYDDGARVIFEVRGLVTKGYRDTTIGVVFHCEGGQLVSAEYAKVIAYDHDGREIRTFEGGGNHCQMFLDAIRSGAPVTADARDGHVSAGMCHMANISHMLGTGQALAGREAALGADIDLSDAFARFQMHVVENGLDPKATEYSLGPSLEFDAATESFVGGDADRANALQTRAYRDGFRVSEYE